MGFRCLFGHDFTNPEHEQERERQDGELVIVTRDVRQCRRCGEEEIITQNTAVVGLDEDTPKRTDTDSTRSETEADHPEKRDDTAPEEGRVSDEAEANTTDTTPTARRDDSKQAALDSSPEDAADSVSTDPGAEAKSSVTPSSDRTNTGDSSETATTDSEATTASEGSQTSASEESQTSVPETKTDGEMKRESAAGSATDTESGETESEAFDDGRPDDDAVILDDTSEERSGRWPGEAANDGKGPEKWEKNRRSKATGETESGSGRSERLRCPNCGMTQHVESTSLRTGDICPECQLEYITRRPE
ncbi:MAG: hypothetical protein PPP58_09990 [Natronomonas sp.]